MNLTNEACGRPQLTHSTIACLPHATSGGCSSKGSRRIFESVLPHFAWPHYRFISVSLSFCFVVSSRYLIVACVAIQNKYLGKWASNSNYLATTTSDKLINNLYSSFIAFFSRFVFIARAASAFLTQHVQQPQVASVCVGL